MFVLYLTQMLVLLSLCDVELLSILVCAAASLLSPYVYMLVYAWHAWIRYVVHLIFPQNKTLLALRGVDI